jgi:hypothetical protein
MLDRDSHEAVPFVAYAMIGITSLVLAYATLSDTTETLKSNVDNIQETAPKQEEPSQGIPVVPVSPMIPVSPFAGVPEPPLAVAEPVSQREGPGPFEPTEKQAGGKRRKNKSIRRKN